MALEKSNLEKAQFLDGIDHTKQLTIAGTHPELRSLQEVLGVVTAPELISVTLGKIHVVTRGDVMRLVILFEDDIEKEDEDNQHLNVALEDNDEITVHGKKPQVKSIHEILQILTEGAQPDVVSVFPGDLQIYVREKILTFVQFMEAERQVAWQKVDLKVDMRPFVLRELKDFLNSLPDQMLELLGSAERLNEVLVILAQRISEYLLLHFPLLNPKLEAHAREIKMIVRVGLSAINVGMADYLSKELSIISDKSLLGKIHDHPSNIAAVMEKMRGGVKK